VAATEIDLWNLDQDDIVPHKDQEGVYFLHAEWRESLARNQIVGFDPVKMTTLATPSDSLPVPGDGRFVLAGILQSGPSAPKKKGNAGSARTVTVALGAAASWASLEALLQNNPLAASLLREKNLALMPPDILATAAAFYPSASYDTGKTVKKQRSSILRSGADANNAFTHCFSYSVPGEATTKYAFCATDGQLAVNDLVHGFVVYTPEQLRHLPSLNEELDKAWGLRTFAIFAQELILSNEEVHVPFDQITGTVLAVHPSYLLYMDGGQTGREYIFAQHVRAPPHARMPQRATPEPRHAVHSLTCGSRLSSPSAQLALDANGQLVRCPAPERATLAAVLRAQLCIGLDVEATREKIQREIERQSVEKTVNLQAVTLYLRNFSAADMLSLGGDLFEQLRPTRKRNLSFELQLPSIKAFKPAIGVPVAALPAARSRHCRMCAFTHHRSHARPQSRWRGPCWPRRPLGERGTALRAPTRCWWTTQPAAVLCWRGASRTSRSTSSSRLPCSPTAPTTRCARPSFRNRRCGALEILSSSSAL
jgi:hypothetical protein